VKVEETKEGKEITDMKGGCGGVNSGIDTRWLL
jgi:hypothetical protein